MTNKDICKRCKGINISPDRRCLDCGALLKGAKIAKALKPDRQIEVDTIIKDYKNSMTPILQELIDNTSDNIGKMFFNTAKVRLELIESHNDLKAWSKDYSKFLHPTLKAIETKVTGDSKVVFEWTNIDSVKEFKVVEGSTTDKLEDNS